MIHMSFVINMHVPFHLQNSCTSVYFWPNPFFFGSLTAPSLVLNIAEGELQDLPNLA